MLSQSKITIVAHALSAGGGISVGKNLIGALQEILPEPRYQVFAPADLDYERSIKAPERSEVHFFRKGWNPLKRLLYDRHFLETQIARFQPDLVLCLGNRGVQYAKGQRLVLCHDPHLFYPARFYAREILKKKILKQLQSRRLKQDLKKTDLLLVQTKVAEERIRKKYRYAGKVMLLPNAVSVDVVSAAQRVAMPKPLQQAKDCFKLFYLTRYYPHKNLELLVKLFERYGKELDDCRMFITIEAGQHPRAKKLLSDIARFGLERHIINVGPLAQSELPAYFSNVDALVMPTTLESFSGTYLEAMSFGCPILTSDLDFARDVCANAALYFDPWSVDSLLQRIQLLRQQPAVAEQLRESGKSRLQQFTSTWEGNGQRLAAEIRIYLENASQGI